MYAEGQSATNPKTGQKIVYKGGQWVNASTEPQNLAKNLTPQERGRIEDLQSGARVMEQTVGQADQFMEYNHKQGTGLGYAIPLVGGALAAMSPDAQGMEAITARMAPAQRIPGSGTTSDRDLEQFLKAVPSIKRPGEGNAAIVRDMHRMASDRAAYADFMDQYAAQNGSLNGAEAAYRARAKTSRPAPTPTPQQASRGGGRGPVGARENPVILNASDPNSSYNNLRPGQYFVTPDGKVGKKSGG